MTENTKDVSDAGSSSALCVGPFYVSTGQKEVELFSRETGWPQIAGNALALIPHTFPMSWLGLPDMHAAIETQLKTACGIAIHESQSFAYEGQLEVDQDYLMSAEMDHQDNPKRLILRIRIDKQTREPVLRMETILRIVTAADKLP